MVCESLDIVMIQLLYLSHLLSVFHHYHLSEPGTPLSLVLLSGLIQSRYISMFAKSLYNSFLELDCSISSRDHALLVIHYQCNGHQGLDYQFKNCVPLILSQVRTYSHCPNWHLIRPYFC